MSLRRSTAAAVLLATTAATAQTAPDAERDGILRPAGGWTHSGLKDEAGTITYAYPANLIDRGGQRGRTLIEGRLKAQGQERRQPLLVVNGQPLPLQRGADGRFARPYVFGPGANSIELRDAEGRSVQRVQFYEANASKTTARVRVILGWDDPQAELDLHVLTPDGQHAFWAHPILTNGGGLDVDSVDGAGPEMFSMMAPLPGAYHVYVNFWGRIGSGGYHFDDAARETPIITARITLVFDENTARERRESFTVPMRRIGDLTHVRSFRRG